MTTSDDVEARDPTRLARGAAWYEYVSQNPPSPTETPFRTAGVTKFVFGEVWPRPGLDHRIRRFISLTCAAMASAPVATKSLVYSSLKSGDISLEEMREFVLHFAVYGGWPKAATLESEVDAAWERVQAEGGPQPRPIPTT